MTYIVYITVFHPSFPVTIVHFFLYLSFYFLLLVFPLTFYDTKNFLLLNSLTSAQLISYVLSSYLYLATWSFRSHYYYVVHTGSLFDTIRIRGHVP
jgi:hypothetical protein